MNKIFTGNNFDDVYASVLDYLAYIPEHTTTNRKGEQLHETINATIEVTDPTKCYAHLRNMSNTYLVGELLWYIRGVNTVKGILPYSKFWSKISDDGINLNSCYGYHLYKKSTPGIIDNQFSYCLNQLIKNKESKKAVATIYEGSHHSYETRDNPCTMYLHFAIREDKLILTVHMRSNDVWFGLPYDVPYFCFVQHQMYFKLLEYYPELKIGSYVHLAGSLHLYERNREEAVSCLKNPYDAVPIPPITTETIKEIPALMSYEKVKPTHKPAKKMKDEWIIWAKKMIDNHRWLQEAWKVSKQSKCLKKEVGGIYVKENKIIASGWSGRPTAMGACEVCTRKTDTFYQDGCNSIHSEYRAFFRATARGVKSSEFKGSTVYLTHGPCDQCMKLLVELGVKRCVFDVYYKTSFKKYTGCIIVEDKNGRLLCTK